MPPPPQHDPIITLATHLIKSTTTTTYLPKARQIHALILTSIPIYSQTPFVYNHVISMCVRSGSLSDARKVFDKMPVRNVVSYNSMIAAYAKENGCVGLGFEVVKEMMRWDGIRPNGVTFTSLLRGVSSVRDRVLGMCVHGMVVKFGLFCDAWVNTALLGLYSSVGDMESAEGLFTSLEFGDDVSWNCMLSGYLKNGRMREGLCLFIEMVKSGVVPTEFTYSMVFNACARLGDHACGRVIHGWVVVSGVPVDLPLQNSLLDMYSSCGDTKAAFTVFRGIENPDLVSCNSMLSGCAERGSGELAMRLYVQLLRTSVDAPDEYTFAALISAVGELPFAMYGEPLHAQVVKFDCVQSVFVGSPLISLYFMNQRSEYAERVFYFMSTKDLVLWTEMITGYSKMGDGENAVKYYSNMRQEGHRLDGFVISSVLNACADLATPKQGEMIHCQAIKVGCIEEMPVSGSLIDMYAKNGDLHAARSVFSMVSNPDLKCWNSMIGGYSHHGKAEVALDLFNNLVSRGLKPDNVTFISLLTACSHCGLISEGKYLWSYMKENEVAVGPQHYSCMVSSLSRAGLVEEAEKLINESPFENSRVELWRTLLSSSVASKNLAVGVRSAEHILKCNPDDSATHMLLSNLYAVTGRWNSMLEIRKRVRGLMLEKDPGLSWIEITTGLNVFSSGDQSHSRTGDVEAVLEWLQANMVLGSNQDEFAANTESCIYRHATMIIV
ncbi:hypothetical protein Droror1_Dr00010680 [Drosera rotundifolia]